MANNEEIELQERHKRRNDGFVPLRSLDLGKCRDFDILAREMCFTAFGGRQLGEAVDVLEAMLRDKKCFKVLTLSGAMTIAKMGMIVCDMIDNDMVDAVITTGALMTHGFIEATGMAHFKNPGNLSDEELFKLGYDRVYDTLESEANLDEAEKIIMVVFDNTNRSKPTCSYMLNLELGRLLNKKYQGRSILKSAALKNVPVFVPAFTDSEMGLDFGMYNRRMRISGKKPMLFDAFLDLEKYTEMVFKAQTLGIFTIGGGVPRNWAQQVGPYLEAIKFRSVNKGYKEKSEVQNTDVQNKDYDPYVKKFKYGVRICPEPVHWGGLSGCTYSEGVSWGKFVPKSKGGMFAEVMCDATIAWPIVIKAITERLKKNPIKK